MESVYVREQKRYTQNNLIELFKTSEENTVRIIKKLKEYNILKTVRRSDAQKDLSELIEEDIEITDVVTGQAEYYYVFTFVGVITVGGLVLKCFPKYLLSYGEIENQPKEQLKQVIKVLEKYNSKEQIIRMYNETYEGASFNLLAVILYLLNDYYEYGSYSNTQDITEINGSGEINWDRTINETFTMISNNHPYYPELITKRRKNNDYDYFKRLHECILTKCSKELDSAELLDLFGINGLDLSDEEVDDFGDTDYILDRLQEEINVQFNTRKQLLLKSLYTYIAHGGTMNDIDCFSMYGTNSFNLVWEKACAEILDNQLQTPLEDLDLPTGLHHEYTNTNKRLIDIIDHPIWFGNKAEGGHFKRRADQTLIPDIITIYHEDDECRCIIFDAKYYNLQLEEGKPLTGQPGVESVTKQYLYNMAYKKFLHDHGITYVRNCFLMPAEGDDIIETGYVAMSFLQAAGLTDIQIRLLPAEKVFDKYLSGAKYNISQLNL